LLQALAPRRLAVFRALQLGDMLCAVPALRALRAALPGAHITLIGLPWARGFVSRFARYVDAHLAFPGHAGLPEQRPDEAAFASFVAETRERRFDLVVQMHGDGRITNGIVRRLGVKASAGFASAADDAWCPFPARGPEIRRLLGLATHLGAPARGEALEFPLSERDELELRAFARLRGIPLAPCVCLHPGARALERRWPAAQFARVGDALHTRFGLPIVLTGSEAEAPLTGAVARAMTAPACDAAGPISIGALAAQLARARLVVTNDTGVSHVAAALGVPSVVIFMASDPERWAPLDRVRHRAVCDPAGARPGEVLAQAEQLLGSPTRAPAPA
jgi:ADP-heptose:LPS heptosyltransferase